MPQHLLRVRASDSRNVPARICGLIAQRKIPVTSIEMRTEGLSSPWSIDLVVSAEPGAEIELVVRRLLRLVDVLEVTVIESALARSVGD